MARRRGDVGAKPPEPSPAGAEPPKNKGGRPRATIEEQEARWPVLEQIIDRVSHGETLSAICREERAKQKDAGQEVTFPAEGTVRLWYVYDEPAGFSTAYARAREGQAEAWADQVVEIADDGSRDTITKKGRNGEEYEAPDYEWMNRSKLRVDTRKWLMAKLHPAKYGEALDLTSKGEKLESQTIVIAGREVKF